MDWDWRARHRGGPFDFGDETDFRLGINLFTEMLRKRCSRGRPDSASILRGTLTMRWTMYLLKAQVDVAALAEQEARATGWTAAITHPRGCELAVLSRVEPFSDWKIAFRNRVPAN